MNDLNGVIFQYYQQNIDLIRHEWRELSYSDKDVHEQAMKWTLSDFECYIQQVLKEFYEPTTGENDV